MPYGTSDGQTFDTPFDLIQSDFSATKSMVNAMEMDDPLAHSDLGAREAGKMNADINPAGYHQFANKPIEELPVGIDRTLKGDRLDQQEFNVAKGDRLDIAATTKPTEASMLPPTTLGDKEELKQGGKRIEPISDNSGYLPGFKQLVDYHEKQYGKQPKFEWADVISKIAMSMNLLAPRAGIPPSLPGRNALTAQLQARQGTALPEVPGVRQNLEGPVMSQRQQAGSIEQAGVDTFNRDLATGPTGQSTAPGSITRLGQAVYDRELGRRPSGRFGRVPEDMSRGRGGPTFEENQASPVRAVTLTPEQNEMVTSARDIPRGYRFSDTINEVIAAGRIPRGWQSVEGGALVDRTNTPVRSIKGDKSNFDALTIQRDEHSSRVEFQTTDNSGYISISPRREGRDLYVNGIYADNGPNSLGKTHVRELLNTLAKEYPRAETISGFRVSGARGAADSRSTASMKLPRIRQTEEVQ